MNATSSTQPQPQPQPKPQPKPKRKSAQGRNQHNKRTRHDPIIGEQFGELLVLRRLPDKTTGAKNVRARVLARCTCGRVIETPRYYLLRKTAPKASCGKCHIPFSPSDVLQGLPPSYFPEYTIWQLMRFRCQNPKHISYASYGGRGIRVCDEWNQPYYGFRQFLKDVGYRPTPFHSLDRQDANGNYEPSNVKWATTTEQARNKRNTKYVVHPSTGLAIKAAELADELGLTYQQLRALMIKEGVW